MGGEAVRLGLHAKQIQAFNSPATEILYGGAAGGGKAMKLSTEIKTLNRGWQTMGSLQVGDIVFGSDGSPTNVIGKTKPFIPEKMYRLTLNTGETFDVDAGHLWLTLTDKERTSNLRRTPEWRENRKAKRKSRAVEKPKRPNQSQAAAKANAARVHDYLAPIPPQARTTQEIADTLLHRGRIRNHSIEVAGAIFGHDVDTDIDPYLLGVWLGDGCKTNGVIGMLPDDLDRIIEETDTPLYARRNARKNFDQARFHGLKMLLKKADLIGNKHIPDEYMNASPSQRLALLQGIMDTDGTVAKSSGACEICLSDKRLFDDVFELVASMGIKVTRRIKKTARRDAHIMKFYSELPMFRLERKLILQNRSPKAEYVRRRYIVSAEVIEPEMVACIEVDNQDHSYLVGRTFVTTHNSHLMRIASIVWCLEIPGLQVYLFRRVFDDLVKNHVEGPNGYRAVLHPWVKSGDVEIVESEIRFKNGSKIHLCHVQQEKHRFKYQGSEIHVLLIDELTLFTDTIYRFLRNRVRMTGIKLPAKYEGKFPRILCGSNPGNIGHLFVKRTFIDNVTPLQIRRTRDDEGGMLRQYIPARLDDNPSLKESDPTYEARLSGLGSESLVKAMKDGDWDVIDGAFFDNWENKRHVVEPFRVPAEWTRFRSMDWGYAKPFSVGWWAISDGRYGPFPRGSLIRYREWYGCKKDDRGVSIPDTGVRLDVDKVRDRMLELSKGEQFAYTVCDPAMWSTQSGPSPAETLYNETGQGIKTLKKANNARVGTQNASGGWDQLRARLTGQMCNDGEKRPLIYFFDTCVDAIRTIPALIHDEIRIEDINTDQEDHIADETRYACMSRPIIIKRPQDGPRTPPAGHFESNGIIMPPTPQGWGVREEDLDR